MLTWFLRLIAGRSILDPIGGGGHTDGGSFIDPLGG